MCFYSLWLDILLDLEPQTNFNMSQMILGIASIEKEGT